MISIDPAGPHNRPARDHRAVVVQGQLSAVPAMEITFTGRAAADRHEPPRADPADEHRRPAVGSGRPANSELLQENEDAPNRHRALRAHSLRLFSSRRSALRLKKGLLR